MRSSCLSDLETGKEFPQVSDNSDDVGSNEECFCNSDGAPHVLELTPSSSVVSSRSSPPIPPGIISFRPLQAEDRELVQDLHEEWFPVAYKEEFYDELVHHRMVHSGEKLFTCAAIYHPDDQSTQTLPEDDNRPAPLCQEPVLEGGSPLIRPKESRGQNHNCQNCSQVAPLDDDDMVGCVVGTMFDLQRVGKETASLLISNPEKYTRLFYIMTLGTVSEFRKLGLATTLVKKCLDVADRDGRCGVVYLHVITFNVAAIHFYEKLGFYRVKEIEKYYRINGKLYNCYLYARYFHGNAGQWDIYYHLVSRVVATLWEKVRTPFGLLMNQPQSLATQQPQEEVKYPSVFNQEGISHCEKEKPKICEPTSQL